MLCIQIKNSQEPDVAKEANLKADVLEGDIVKASWIELTSETIAIEERHSPQKRFWKVESNEGSFNLLFVAVGLSTWNFLRVYTVNKLLE